MRLALTSALTLMAVGVAPASADVGRHCQQSGYCLFSGSGFDGTKVVVPAGYGCQPVTPLGIDVARSAARGFGDSHVLELFADNACANRIAVATDEVAETSARTYRLTMIPS